MNCFLLVLVWLIKGFLQRFIQYASGLDLISFDDILKPQRFTIILNSSLHLRQQEPKEDPKAFNNNKNPQKKTRFKHFFFVVVAIDLFKLSS
jgi:hypothetical protein